LAIFAALEKCPRCGGAQSAIMFEGRFLAGSPTGPDTEFRTGCRNPIRHPPHLSPSLVCSAPGLELHAAPDPVARRLANERYAQLQLGSDVIDSGSVAPEPGSLLEPIPLASSDPESTPKPCVATARPSQKVERINAGHLLGEAYLRLISNDELCVNGRMGVGLVLWREKQNRFSEGMGGLVGEQPDSGLSCIVTMLGFHLLSPGFRRARASGPSVWPPSGDRYP
jgi:hypothetical protein